MRLIKKSYTASFRCSLLFRQLETNNPPILLVFFCPCLNYLNRYISSYAPLEIVQAETKILRNMGRLFISCCLRNVQEINLTTDLPFYPPSTLHKQLHSLLCACLCASNANKNSAPVVKFNFFSFLSICLALTQGVLADEVRVAVAANFTTAIKTLTPGFEKATGHQLIASFASTGKLYAQITNGAPFDILLSADKARPEKLEQTGFGVPDTRFTYACGQLVLWEHPPGTGEINVEQLRKGEFRHLAIANPKTAPYGKAAMEVLEHLNLADPLEKKLVRGESIAQTMQFVHSGAADMGFIALSQLKTLRAKGSGYWEIPANFYSPIEQQAILLERGRANLAARDFLDYLKQPEARKVILSLGYAIENNGKPSHE